MRSSFLFRFLSLCGQVCLAALVAAAMIASGCGTARVTASQDVATRTPRSEAVPTTHGAGAGLNPGADGAVFRTVRPIPEALHALDPGSGVRASLSPWLEFAPIGRPPAAGLVLYPGARIDVRAYAPPARALAEAGYLVAVPAMPLGMAFLDIGAARKVMAAHPDIRAWAVGGHSLGGVAAARFAAGRPAPVAGLVLWASYPDSLTDLSRSKLVAASIFGTHDGRTRPETVAATAHLLPPATRLVELAGANHAQFGWYGDQEGDRLAVVSREEQTRQVVSATADLLSRLGSAVFAR
ncbi:MAG: alpha/beta hydrolase [Candidatus Sericytochromatia bacterium]|uniref:Alpha/beta hydrolase n=1 Tax=Candidatus Tanganyikabacteria bacterium TaxID=2961651 RepID=A0A937X711_9BACT|nr:alpha/beta hydrolase [Candidatus Tanganyikabacteria bacterium]